MNQLNHRQTKILSVFSPDKPLSPKQLSNLSDKEITTITLSRDLSLLLSKNYLLRIGHGPKTTYKLTNKGLLFRPIDIDKYFSIPIDSRNILPNFNFSIFSTLKNSDIFNKDETKQLLKLQKNICKISKSYHQP